MTQFTIGQEGQLKSSEGEIFNFRIYNDGAAKVESSNSFESFDTIEQIESYIKSYKLEVTEIY